MIIESLFVFLHLTGATGLLAAIAVEGACVVVLARTRSVEEARAVLRPLSVSWRVAPVAMLTTLGSGAWLMSRGWGPRPWIFAGLAALTGMGLDGFRTRRRLAPLRRALASPLEPESAVPEHDRPGPPWLRAGLGLAALAVMTLRPGVVGSILFLAAAVALSSLVSAPGISPSDRSEPPGPRRPSPAGVRPAGPAESARG